MKKRTAHAIRAIATLMLISCSTTLAANDVTIEKRALTGDQVPGAAPGVQFSTFTWPSINAAGEVAFKSQLAGPGVDATNNQGVYSGLAGSIDEIARTGNPVPGAGPGVVFGSITATPVINHLGNSSFVAGLAGAGITTTNNAGIFAGSPGSLSLIMRNGVSAPGIGGGVTIGTFGNPTNGNPAFNINNRSAFIADLSGPNVNSTNQRAIYTDASGPLTLVARQGNPAPGAGVGVEFDQVGSPVINSAGHVAFDCDLRGPGIVSQSSGAICSNRSGALQLVTRGGDVAPGVTGNANLGLFGTPAINDAGQIAFGATLTGPGVSSSNNTGIFSEGGGALSLVAREGSQVPGAATGVKFNIFGNPLINRKGQTAFHAHLTGPGILPGAGGAIFAEMNGGLEMIAAAGDSVPDVGPGAFFRNDFTNPSINSSGQVSFLDRFFLPGFGESHGIFATDRDGVLRTIAYEGQMIDVSNNPHDNDYRTIAALTYLTGTGLEDGRRMSLTDNGELSFWAAFSDGSTGVFVATIPEPSCALLLGCGLLAALFRRRRG